jgi:PAS domain S-box-containing protein
LTVGLANHTVLISRDGREMAIDDSAAPIRDAAGKIFGAVMVFHDATEQRRAQTAVRENSERLQLAFSAGQLGDWSWDATTDVVTLGARAADIFGLPRARPVTWTKLRELLHEDDRERARRAVEKALADRSDYNIEYRVKRQTGGHVWIAAKGRGIYGPDDAVRGLVGVVQDITERRQAEEIRSRLSAIVKCSDDAIISKTLEGIITSWNKGAELTFGYSAGEVIGKSITLLIPPDHADEERTILDRLKKGERIEHYETVRMRADGTLLDISLTVSPVKDSTGTIIGVSKIARDITARKRMDEALREETRMLELLNKTGTAIASQLDLKTLVQTVTDSGTQLSGAQFGAFFYNVTDDQGESYFLYTL